MKISQNIKVLFFVFSISFLILTVSAGESKCECSHEDDEQNRAGANKYKIAAIPSVLAAGVIRVLFPLLGKFFPSLKPETNFFFITKAFAAGVILATGFMHVLPEGYEKLTSPCLKGKAWEFPFTGFIAMVATILTLSIDSFATSYFHKLHFKTSKRIGEEEGGGGGEELGLHVHAHGHTHGIVAVDSGESDVQLHRTRVIAQVIPNLASRESFERHLAEYMAAQGPFDGDSTPSYAQLYTFMTHNASQVQPTTPRSTRSSNPGIQCSEPIPHMTLDELLLTPNRHRLRQLDPDRKDGATWFKHDPSTKITKAILRMMKSYLNKPYATYRNMPYEEKEAWLIAFAQEFNWDPIHTPAVREAFEIQAKASFSTNVHGWKHRWQTKQGKPDWFNDNLWKGYVKLWRKEDVVAKAAQNSLNRRSERGGDGIAKHHTGSKTYERRKDELTVLNGGEEPSMLALLEDVHKNKKTGVISDGKAQRIIQTCKTQIQQSQSVRQSQQSTDGGVEGSIVMSQSEINKLVLDMTPKVKGRRFGFGTLSDAVGSSSTTFSGSKEKELRLANEENVQLREKVSYLTEVIEKVLNRFPEFVPNRPNPDTIDG